MKINKINIISFGGIKKLNLDFDNGFNCIFGENEHGKTTIMSFIKMMFYGNSYSGSVLANNLRKKYTPWDGSPMSGIIEFETDGKKYKLEREFKKSNSTDKVSLTDLSIGEKQSVESDIGNRLFGLSASAFERSIFIGQLGYPESDQSAESELNKRLSNIATTGEEKVSLEEVSAKLEKARFSLISKNGKSGEYYKNSIIAKELSDKLNISINANNNYSATKEKLMYHIKETDKLKEKADLLKTQLKKEQDFKNAKKLKEYIEIKEKLENVKAELTLNDGTPVDETFFRSIKFSMAKLEEVKNKISAKENEIQIIKKQLDALSDISSIQNGDSYEKLYTDLDLLEQDLILTCQKNDELNSKINKLVEKRNKTKAKFNPVFLCLGIVLLIAGGTTYFVSFIPSMILTVLGIALTIIAFFVKSDKKIQLANEEIASMQNFLSNNISHSEDLKSQIADKKSRIEAIRLTTVTNSQIISNQHSQLTICENDLNSLKNEKQNCYNTLTELLNKLSQKEQNSNETLEFLEKSIQKQKELKNQINFLLRDLNNITYEKAKAKLAEITCSPDSGMDFDKLRNEFEIIQKEISQRTTEESVVATELKALITGIENPNVLKSKLDELSLILKSQKDFCDSADIAIDVLKESFAELRQSFGSVLEKKSAENFSKLTRGKYANMTVSKSFEINVEESENPISREAAYLSSGTFDQAYLSVRLAVADLLGHNLPLFLDDILSQYDDARAKSTFEFLNEYACDNQVIMFTCHNSIKEMAEKLNCKIKVL